MTDARERLVATISDIYAPRSGTTFGWEQRLTDAIADFVCEEIGNGWAKRVVMNSNAIEAALKRLEAVERETWVLREATGVEMNRTEEGTRWWVKGQPVPAPDREFQDKVERKFAEQIKDAGGQPDPTATFTCDDCGRRPTRIAFQLCDACWDRYERPV